MVTAIVAIMAAIAVPRRRASPCSASGNRKLRLDLRLMRGAIDDYKHLADQG